tara:strand:- start:429 stop:695 length:267 start_codon:yes stop_codon:yes gene_type:complete
VLYPKLFIDAENDENDENIKNKKYALHNLINIYIYIGIVLVNKEQNPLYLLLFDNIVLVYLRNNIVDYKVFKKYIQCNIEHELFQKFM